MTIKGIRIREVTPDSLAQQLGLLAGDEIVSVDGNSIPDELALRFHLAADEVRMEVRRSNGLSKHLDLDLSRGDSLGITVEEFRTRTCNNACLFCFIDQLPEGIRPALRVKDDDYRLSFLHGNYITLTNLPEKELDRIIEQRLSPLYVSVHATEVDLRTQILGRRKADNLERKMLKLIAGGIRLNTQIVLMPEINDGPHLERTVFDLYAYYPGVHSIAIVPLGLSDHGRPREFYKAVTASYCRDVIAQVTPWQKTFRAKTGRTFAYLADEFYIQGGEPLPDIFHYDDFAQYEDGIGMVRRFLQEFDVESAKWRRPRPHLHGTLTTAKLFYPSLSECIARFNAKFRSRLKVRAVENRFMGKAITVAGLLSANDLIDTLEGNVDGDFVIIPHECVSRVDGRLVDNKRPEEVADRVGKPVYSSGATMRDFFQLLLGADAPVPLSP